MNGPFGNASWFDVSDYLFLLKNNFKVLGLLKNIQTIEYYSLCWRYITSVPIEEGIPREPTRTPLA